MSDLLPNIPSADDRQPLRLVTTSDPLTSDAVQELHDGLMQRGANIDPAFDDTDLLFRQIFDQALGVPQGDIHSMQAIRKEAGQLLRAIEELSVIELSRFEMKPVRDFIKDYEMKLANIANGPGRTNRAKKKVSPLAQQYVEVANHILSALYVELADIAAESQLADIAHFAQLDTDVKVDGPKSKRSIDIQSGMLGMSMEQLRRIETPEINGPAPQKGGTPKRGGRSQGGLTIAS